MSSCHVTVVKRYLNISCRCGVRGTLPICTCACLALQTFQLFTFSLLRLSFPWISLLLRGGVQTWPDFILAAQCNTCSLKETIHIYIWHSLDICVCVCSRCIFMCAIIPDGYGAHKSALILNESHRKIQQSPMSLPPKHLSVTCQESGWYKSIHHSIMLFHCTQPCLTWCVALLSRTVTKVHSVSAKPLTLAQTPLPVSHLKTRGHNCHCPLAVAIEGHWLWKRHFINFEPSILYYK